MHGIQAHGVRCVIDSQIWRAKIYDFVQSQKCKRCIGWLILANSLLLVVPWYDKEKNDPNLTEPPLTRNLAYASSAFNLLFFAEAVLKIISLNFNGYFQSLRNRFDFVINVSGMLFNVLLLFPVCSHLMNLLNRYVNNLFCSIKNRFLNK